VFSSADLLHLAAGALERARIEGNGAVERLSVRREPLGELTAPLHTPLL
jgi:hypothetical protein